MLVLTRRVGEEIVIDGEIRVKILAIDGGKVKLGISAPPEVLVDRQEVHDRRASLEAPIEQEMPALDSVGDELDVLSWPPVELGVGD
jgi:carbon storage regulator